jgi:hypothetical protein
VLRAGLLTMNRVDSGAVLKDSKEWKVTDQTIST